MQMFVFWPLHLGNCLFFFSFSVLSRFPKTTTVQTIDCNLHKEVHGGSRSNIFVAWIVLGTRRPVSFAQDGRPSRGMAGEHSS